MFYNFEGKVALVTGASRGIGYSIAKELASKKTSLVLSSTKQNRLDEVVAELKSEYKVEILGIAGDVSCHDDVKNIIQSGLNRFSKIDYLINNAGITRDGLLMRMKEKDWDDVFSINLRSVFLMTKEIIRHMVKNKGGRIVNISSIVGQVGGAGQSNYSASKAGVIAFTKSIAQEMGAKNILANVVAPGFIDTDMTDVLSEERKQLIMDNIPLNKMGNPKDIANAVVFLCSDMASYITGQTLGVNGGLFMQ